MTHKHTFGRITTHNDTLRLPIYDASNNLVECVTFQRDELAAVLIELVATFDIAPCKMSDICPADIAGVLLGFPKQFVGLEVGYDDQAGVDRFVATLRNGDTGNKESGYGNTAVEAVATLARDNGFKSKLQTPNAPEITIVQWFEDFKYGFSRIAEEILAAEMDDMYAPEKGAW